MPLQRCFFKKKEAAKTDVVVRKQNHLHTTHHQSKTKNEKKKLCLGQLGEVDNKEQMSIHSDYEPSIRESAQGSISSRKVGTAIFRLKKRERTKILGLFYAAIVLFVVPVWGNPRCVSGRGGEVMVLSGQARARVLQGQARKEFSREFVIVENIVRKLCAKIGVIFN